jgi:hypothetical protein
VLDADDEELAMSWFYVDDQFDDHPKLAELPPELELACVGLWTKAGSWCRRKLTGGQIPHGQVRKLGGTKELAEALVKAGLWESTSTGYAFHNWSTWQETPEELQAKRDRWRAQKANRRRVLRAAPADPPPDPPTGGGVSAPDTRADSARTGNGQDGGLGAESASCPPDVRTPVQGIPNSQFPGTQIPDPKPTPKAPRAGARVYAREEPDGEPEREPSTLELVEAEHRRRLIEATGNPPGSTRTLREHYRAIAAWVDEKNGNAEVLVRRIFAGFWGDKWAKKNLWPLGALANDPGRYLQGKKNGFHRVNGSSGTNGPPTASDLNLIGPPAPGEAE